MSSRQVPPPIPLGEKLIHSRECRIRAPLRDRSPLLPLSGRSSPGGGHFGEPSGHRYADDLEGQNDEMLEGLSAKVKLLKDITIGIGNEVRESTVQLSHMNDAFAETSGILSGTFRRMNNMAARQGCRWLWYIVFMVIVFWFFLVVWWFRR
ncbi:protein transport protein BET1 [Armillaria borealis]|uniref:Protein transport protein BET1 n=1 Tax=Armillaria borealis TaxID=47425 RepID=A0AA39N3S1_9AGAR|nr:protein transport protein BET1 [Armillaria borealis]